MMETVKPMPTFTGDPVVTVGSAELVAARVVAGVQVVSFDAQGEPEAVATFYLDEEGRAVMTAPSKEKERLAAGKAYGPLLTVTKKAGALIAHQTLIESLKESVTLTTSTKRL
jgi:hypothetical protein